MGPTRATAPSWSEVALRRSGGDWMERPDRGQPGQEEETLAYDESVLGGSAFVQDLLAEADWDGKQALHDRRRCESGEPQSERRTVSIRRTRREGCRREGGARNVRC